MKIIVHRGAEEIGGNCIELRSGESRILLDYGAPLPRINPVTHKSENLPLEKAEHKIEGLYGPGKARLDGLIISHTHQDHYGMLYGRPLNPALPVYMSEIMEAIIRITGKMGPGHKDFTAKIEHFKKEVPFTVGAFTLTPYLMDHSASESFGFLIEAEGKKVIYTGDYRDHGHRTNIFKKFLETRMGQIDLLITEGTQAGVETGDNEKKVMMDIEKLIRSDSGALYVMCSGQNVDLLASLGGIAARKGRFLAIDGYVALILETLKELALKQGLRLQLPGLESEYLKVLDTPTMKNLRKYYPEAAEKISGKLVSWSWVNENPDKLVIPVRTYAQTWVSGNIKSFKNGILVYSMWEGYKEDLEYQKTLEYFKARGMDAHSAHVSGHAYFSTIRKLIENKKPKHIIPIHTEHPEIFRAAFGDRVHPLQNGGEFTLD